MVHQALIRVDIPKHINRWYLVCVQPTLLEDWGVTCMWGSRQTAYQRLRVTPAPSEEDGQALAEIIIGRKMKRGYRLVEGDGK